MNRNFPVIGLLLVLALATSAYGFADSAQDSTVFTSVVPSTASSEDDISSPEPAAKSSPLQAPSPAPSPTKPYAAPVSEPVQPEGATVATEKPVLQPDTSDSSSSAPMTNPYSNVSNPEFSLLQQMAAELKADALHGLDAAQTTLHAGQYGVDNYVEMIKAFADAAETLDSTLRSSPIDIRNVHMTIKALKTLVLDIDDVFAYNPNYLNQLRNWNECKRILRRIDGIVYREGGLRRFESIVDANPWLRSVGKFFNMHGVLSGVEDTLHRNNTTAPMDALVGHHGGGRKATHVWMVANSTYQGELANGSSAMNEGVTQF